MVEPFIPMLVGVVLGKIFAELCDFVKDAIEKVKAFKPELEEIQLVLESLEPLVKKIDQLSRKNGCTPDEAGPLIRRMEESKELVKKCSKVNCLKRLKYTEKLRKLAESLKPYKEINVQQSRDDKEILDKLKIINHKLNGQTDGAVHKKINSDVDHKEEPKKVNSEKKIYPDPTSNELKKEEPKKINSDLHHKEEPKKVNSYKKIYPEPTRNELKKEEPKKINSDVDHPKKVNSDKKIYPDPTGNLLKKEGPKKINSDVDHKEEPKKIDNGFRGFAFAEDLMFYMQKKEPEKIDKNLRQFAVSLKFYTQNEVPVQPKKINSDVDHKEEPKKQKPKKVNSDKKIHA